MAGRSSERSNLIDITYGQLHQYLSGGLEGTSSTQVMEYLTPRVKQFQNLRDPFGHPSDISRKRIQSGSITLEDGVVFHIEDADKDFVLAVSSAFKIDEISAFILLRSFMYNQGLPAFDSRESLVEACVEAITPFYLSERLSVFRVLIPLFRAKEDPLDPAFEISSSFLPRILSDGPQFVNQLLTEYTRKTKEGFDKTLVKHTKSAHQWARQDLKEQLVLLEVLFWTMWGSVSCSGSLVADILSTAFSTNLGTTHADSSIFFDQEAQRIEQDIAALWNLITIEILELETLSDSNAIQVADSPSRPDLYISSPSDLQRIHGLILSNDGSQFVCVHLAWAYVLTRLLNAVSDLQLAPQSYQLFLQSLGGNRPIHLAILESCLRPENRLFSVMSRMLTASPFFVTMLAFKTDSSVTDTNVIAFRSVFKGLVVALLDMTSPESIPDFDGFVDVWITLFGRSESHTVAAICRQYWEFDWHYAASRRAIFDVARSRFPIHVKPLIRIARAMTGAGFLDTDPLCASDDIQDTFGLSDDRRACDGYVFDFMNSLPTYSQIIQSQFCTGAHAIYEKVPDRSSSSSTIGHSYTNLRPIQLPGGSILPVGSTGRALNSEGGEFMAICWSHQHSGWRLMLELLTEYVNRRSIYPGRKRQNPPPVDRSSPLILSLEDAGVDMDGGVDESLVTNILDLIRSAVQDNPDQAAQLMLSLEVPARRTSSPPDLVQLVMTILEDAFSSVASRSSKASLPTPLITSALSVLSAILAIPHFSQRVWIYLKSTTVLFGTGRTGGTASVALRAERAGGRYNVTLSVLHLVQQLLHDASAIAIPEDPHLNRLKGEVMLNAVRFVHSEIWVEHVGWRYANVGDRFDISRRTSSIFVTVLEQSPEDIRQGPFPELSELVLDLLLLKASHSTINPLVSSVAAGKQMLETLNLSQRKADAKRVILLLQSKLRLMYLLLSRKRLLVDSAGKLCLLEQMMCSHASHNSVTDPTQSRADTIDVLALYVTERDVGSIVPLEAIRVLSALCRSLSSMTSAPAIVGHLSSPEDTASAFVRIVQHPYEDLTLRYAVWNFITLAMDAEPALAKVFVLGRLHALNGPEADKGTSKDIALKGSSVTTAMDVAKEALEGWDDLWEHNPQLLCAVVRFLDATWQHSYEHKSPFDELRKDPTFWSRISALAYRDLGPLPELDAEEMVVIDNVLHSSMHDTVSMHCYRVAAKGHALHIIGLDIGQTYQRASPSTRSESFQSVESRFRKEEELMDMLSEAIVTSYRPEIYDELEELLKNRFHGLLISQFQVQDPIDDREYGDRFSLSLVLLHRRIKSRHDPDAMVDQVDETERRFISINLNQSLSHSQLFLTDSARFLLQKMAPYVRGDASIRRNCLSVGVSLSYDLAGEKRLGDMVATIHGKRLSVLLGVLEVAWFSTIDKAEDVKSFVEVTGNVRGIILNEYQRPLASLMGSFTVPFHRTVLLITFWCMKSARTMLRLSKGLKAEHRLKVAETVDAALSLVIDCLHITFTGARTKMDVDIDKDMELLVSVFEQCSRRDITPSSSTWLLRCEESNIIEESLQLFAHTDLVGLSDLNLLINRHLPLYVPHILLFHMALASVPSAAERLAAKGLLPTYSNNLISSAISSGHIDVTIPEFSGHRSPAHYVYCSMLAIVSGVTTSLGRDNPYFDVEVCGLIQLFSSQISRAASWTVGDSISLALVEELEQVVHLFFSVAESGASTSYRDPIVDKNLRFFTPHALRLLQQVNYAITHPHQLASLFYAISEDEEVLLNGKSDNDDPLKRPLVVHLLHRLYRLSSNIVFALISISRAYAVLLGDEEDWPIQEAVVVPHSKVVLEEPASLGTLLELGNSTLDMLKDLVNLPAGQSLIGVGPVLATRYANNLDVKHGVVIARRNLEGIVIYATTQLALCLSKPDFDTVANDTDMDDLDIGRSDPAKERRAPRGSMTLADRLRRGMTSEMAADLLSLLEKAKPVMKQSDVVLGTGAADLSDILTVFIRERISSS